SSICCRRGRLSPKCSPTTASCVIRLGRARGLEKTLEVSAILATNKTNKLLQAGHANAIGQRREIQLRSADRHGPRRARDGRKTWAGRRCGDRRRGIRATEGNRIGGQCQSARFNRKAITRRGLKVTVKLLERPRLRNHQLANFQIMTAKLTPRFQSLKQIGGGRGR